MTQSSPGRVATLVAALLIPAFAQAAEPATRSILIRNVDRHPDTPAAARAVLARLGDAAVAACGGSSFDLAEVRRSIRGSACWHDSMADAVARIGDPRVTAAYADARQADREQALTRVGS